MHYAVSYFFPKMDPPKTHTTSPPFPGKEVLSPPLSEPSFPVVKKLIQKVLVALRNGDPQIGHFTLDTLIYVCMCMSSGHVLFIVSNAHGHSEDVRIPHLGGANLIPGWPSGGRPGNRPPARIKKKHWPK